MSRPSSPLASALRTAALILALAPLASCGYGHTFVPPDTWYVSPDGDDSAFGSESSAPLRNIQLAINRAIQVQEKYGSAPEEIRVAQGTYVPGAGLMPLRVGLYVAVGDITITGGWDASFSSRDPAARSVLDGQGSPGAGRRHRGGSTLRISRTAPLPAM